MSLKGCCQTRILRWVRQCVNKLQQSVLLSVAQCRLPVKTNIAHCVADRVPAPAAGTCARASGKVPAFAWGICRSLCRTLNCSHMPRHAHAVPSAKVHWRSSTCSYEALSKLHGLLRRCLARSLTRSAAKPSWARQSRLLWRSWSI